MFLWLFKSTFLSHFRDAGRGRCESGVRRESRIALVCTAGTSCTSTCPHEQLAVFAVFCSFVLGAPTNFVPHQRRFGRAAGGRILDRGPRYASGRTTKPEKHVRSIERTQWQKIPRTRRSHITGKGFDYRMHRKNSESRQKLFNIEKQTNSKTLSDWSVKRTHGRRQSLLCLWQISNNIL